MSSKNDSTATSIVQLTALLPWWGGVMLAGASYGALHLYVSRPLPSSGFNSESILQAMGHGLATYGQYLLPLLFLIADGGVDVVLRKDGEKYFVQCKHWRAQTVSVPIVRDLYGAMAAQGAAGGFVVTSGRFTKPARDFAEGRNVTLIDGQQLHAMISKVPQALPAQVTSTPVVERIDVPACPSCGREMVTRKASRGPQAGQSFWGCSGYPSCKATRAIA